MNVLTNEEYQALCECEKHLKFLAESVTARGQKVNNKTISDVVTRVGQLQHCCAVLEGLVSVEHRDLVEWTLWDELTQQKCIDKKIWPKPFAQILAGNKTAEVRLYEVGLKVGQLIHLREWCPRKKDYTKRSVLIKISHIEKLKELPYYTLEEVLEDGLMVLSFNEMRPVPD